MVDTLISEHPIFAAMSPENVALMAECAQDVVFEQGDFILRDEGRANKFYIIKSGHISLEIYVPGHGTLLIETLKEGILGWSWLFPPYQWHFDARAVERTEAVMFDGKLLREKCETNAAFGFELMRCFTQVVIGRLNAMRMKMLHAYAADEDDD